MNADNLISRLDYDVEIAGNVSGAHYLFDYKEISGIKLATRRVVHHKNKDNTPDTDSPVVVSIDFSDTTLN